jgi:hypothetical protein
MDPHWGYPETWPMRSHRVARGTPAVAFAVLLSISACSSPAAKPPARGIATVATTSNAEATTSTMATTSAGKTHLTAYTNDDGPSSTVVLSGAVGDYGKAQSVNPDGSVNNKHDSQLNLVLSRGSFRLSIAGLDKKLVAAMARLRIDTTTCSGNASVSSPAPVIAGSGTGSYQGIGGTFMLTATLDEVYQPAGCSETSPYLAQVIVITGSGMVTAG